MSILWQKTYATTTTTTTNGMMQFVQGAQLIHHAQDGIVDWLGAGGGNNNNTKNWTMMKFAHNMYPIVMKPTFDLAQQLDAAILCGYWNPLLRIAMP